METKTTGIVYKKILTKCYDDGIGKDGTLMIEDGTSIIDEFACRNLKNLKHLIIPDGVRAIKHSAFQNCPNLETVEFRNKQTECFVGPNAFFSCSKLKTVVLTGKVRLYEGQNSFDRVFCECKNIQEVIVPKGKIIDNRLARQFECKPVYLKIGEKPERTI